MEGEARRREALECRGRWGLGRGSVAVAPPQYGGLGALKFWNLTAQICSFFPRFQDKNSSSIRCFSFSVRYLPCILLHAVSSHVRRATGLGPRIHLVRLLYFRLAAAGTGVVAHSGLRSQFERIRIPRGYIFRRSGENLYLLLSTKKNQNICDQTRFFGSKCIRNAFAAGAGTRNLFWPSEGVWHRGS